MGFIKSLTFTTLKGIRLGGWIKLTAKRSSRSESKGLKPPRTKRSIVRGKVTQINWWLVAVLLLALAFRLAGINHGYPYIYNVDEPALVKTTLGIKFNPIIDHFDWPHFNYYFHYIFYWIFIKFRSVVQILGLKDFLELKFPILWNDPFVFYFISRILSAVLGALTIIPLYLLCKKIYSKNSSLIAGLLFVLIPRHIYNSHFALQETAMLFWLMWGIYYLYIVVISLKSKVRYSVLSGMFFGLAIGVKYNAILFLGFLPLVFVCWHLQSDQSIKNFHELIKIRFKMMLIIIVTSILTFFATTPSIFIKWDVFWSREYGKGIIWQIKDNTEPLRFSEYLSVLPKRFEMVSENIGYPTSYLALLGGLFSVYFFLKFKNDRRRARILLAAFLMVLSYFLYVSRFGRAGPRFFVPIYGLMVLLAIYPVHIFYGKYSKFSSVIIGFIVVFLFLLSWRIDAKFIVDDTRTEALGYYEHVDKFVNRVYYIGEEMKFADAINNLGLKKFNKFEDLISGDLLISEYSVQSDKIGLVKFIENKGRNGPMLYVYSKR